MSYMQVNGLFPSEFDATTNAVLATVQALGITVEELQADQHFLSDMMLVIGSTHAQTITMDETIHVMDMAYIGLIYHRHMPFVDEDTDEKVQLSDRDPVAYTETLSMLSTALIQQFGVNPEQIMDAASDAAAEAIRHLRRPDTLDDDGLRLHTDFIAMCILGLIVHRLCPTTHNHP